MRKDLTTGSVWKTVLSFSLPYFLSYFSQTLYGMADLFIIGQFEGVASTTAVSVGSQVMHMLTVMIVGLAMGSTVSIGQAVGARDMKRAARSIGNTATLFLGLSLVLTVLLLLLVRPIVSVMSTPEAAVAGTVDYQKLNVLHPGPRSGGRRLLPRDHHDRLRHHQRHGKIRHRDQHPRPPPRLGPFLSNVAPLSGKSGHHEGLNPPRRPLFDCFIGPSWPPPPPAGRSW